MARVRLVDVANHAGVSMKTVSNVVHDYPHISTEVRERVQRAIDELGYRPNLHGRRLATGRSGMLALAFSNVSVPYFAELAQVVSNEATRRGYRLLLELTGATQEGEQAVISASEAGLVDGVIFQPSRLTTTEIALHTDEVPLVLLGEAVAPLTVDHVKIDNVAAARDVTEHVIKQGRERIGFVGHESGELSATSRQRLAGFQEALEAADLDVDPGRLVSVGEIAARDAALSVGRALDGGLDVDALICRDDLAAIGTLRALQERGLRVPEDVAVTGWDNIPLAAYTVPSLTTIEADMRQLATRAIDMLEERIGGFGGPGRHELADYRLIVRESAP